MSEHRINSPSEFTFTLLLAHGAGAGMDTEFMNGIAEGVASHGIRVIRFEFPYMVKRRLEGKNTPPNRLPILQSSFLEQMSTIEGPLVIAGKSMGGRVATTILECSNATAGIALGYPFHPPGKPENLRIEHFTSLHKPLLVLQGTRDPFGNAIENPAQWLPDSATLTWVPDGEHSFKPRKASGRTWEDNIQFAIEHIVSFISSLQSQ